MYTLLAGRPPFKAATLLEMLQLQRFAEPDPVRRYAPDVPEELQFIISDLLIKDPDQRIATPMVSVASIRGHAARPVAAIEPSLSAPTRDITQPPIVSVSERHDDGAGPAGSAGGQGRAGSEAESGEYDLEPPVNPHEVTAAARHRAGAESHDRPGIGHRGQDGANSRRAEAAGCGCGRAGEAGVEFRDGSEEEHRRTDAPREHGTPRNILQTAALVAAVVAIGRHLVDDAAGHGRPALRGHRKHQSFPATSLPCKRRTSTSRLSLDTIPMIHAHAVKQHQDDAPPVSAQDRQAERRHPLGRRG